MLGLESSLLLSSCVVRHTSGRCYMLEKIETLTVNTAAITALGNQCVWSLKCCYPQWVLVSAAVSPQTKQSAHVADIPPDRVDV